MDLLAEEMLELISNLKLKLFLLKFKMSSCNSEWFLLPIGELVEPILNFNKNRLELKLKAGTAQLEL